MKNYVFVYDNGGSTGDKPMDEILKDWGVWFGKLGDKLVDGGNPFNDGAKSVTKESVSAAKNPASGYSIVKANSMDEAVEMSKGCPMLVHIPNAVVNVYETLPM
ncbi:hypothetical protein KW794_03180 [Candidatus Saccharibacteria bacterium]|nr:hypothetical protein [Candidatus Saccharibacteria bacterium]